MPSSPSSSSSSSSAATAPPRRPRAEASRLALDLARLRQRTGGPMFDAAWRLARAGRVVARRGPAPDEITGLVDHRGAIRRVTIVLGSEAETRAACDCGDLISSLCVHAVAALLALSQGFASALGRARSRGGPASPRNATPAGDLLDGAESNQQEPELQEPDPEAPAPRRPRRPAPAAELPDCPLVLRLVPEGDTLRLAARTWEDGRETALRPRAERTAEEQQWLGELVRAIGSTGGATGNRLGHEWFRVPASRVNRVMRLLALPGPAQLHVGSLGADPAGIAHEPAILHLRFREEGGALLVAGELDGVSPALTGSPQCIGKGQVWITGGPGFQPVAARHEGIAALARDLIGQKLLLAGQPQGHHIRPDATRLALIRAALTAGDHLPGPRVVAGSPAPILSVDDRRGYLRLHILARYGDGLEVATEGGPEDAALHDAARGWVLRDLDEEAAFAERLSRYPIDHRQGAYETEGAAALDFLADNVPELEAEGWTVRGRDTLVSLAISSAPPRLEIGPLRASTLGRDWFDVDVHFRVGDELGSARALVEALLAGRRYLRLASGTNVRIPPEWRDLLDGPLAAILAPRDRSRRKRAAGRAAGAASAGDAAVHIHRADYVGIRNLLAGGAGRPAATATGGRGCGAWEDLLEQVERYERGAGEPPPAGLRAVLRPYQYAGLRWLRFLRDAGLAGILADDMGLGKTVQVLALLIEEKERARADRPSLVVCPASLAHNWEREAERFAPGLRVLVLNEAGERRRERMAAGLDSHDLAIITYGMLLRDIDALAQATFHYLVLDESQAIKNPDAKTRQAAAALCARHRLALTGTPIENRLTELWSQLDVLMPGFLGTRGAFEATHVEPERDGDLRRPGDGGARAALRRRVGPFILRRLKEDVVPELPPLTDTLIPVDLAPEQAVLYRRLVQVCRREVIAAVDREGIERSQMIILTALLRLRQLCCHPRLLAAAGLEGAETAPSSKLEAFLDLADEIAAEGHRALVFSSFTSFLDLVGEALDARGIGHLRLDGSTPTRERKAVIGRFLAGDAPMFLMSLKAGGLGLNLTAADYVVILDPWWNPAAEAQAAGRAHRIGQEKPVFLYRLVTRGTVEEKILALQEEKRQLAADTIGIDSALGKALRRDELEALFDLGAGAGS